ncbi:MAG TPA: serine/threonine-protein kinase [Ktedonobacteraceae bacterium]|nr:serine/threonine-protein kinase [Ktedonobacteraceae bacterium]
MNAEALIGTVLGTCTLQKLVGQGGMGAVFLAQQSRPRRQVAVKVLLPMTPLSPHQLTAFLERFRRETDAAASLDHPNIMPVYEYGERDGLAYLVMPYISGGTLRDELEREGMLPLSKVVNYLDQMAVALDAAHEYGVIHRDIKPANILMTPEKRLLLTDFGLVKIVAEGRIPQMRLTGAGAPVGTPDYMAPEQVIGEEVDARADLYSLGVILYQMVTGTTPFQGETPMQIAAQHLQIPPPSPQMLRSDLPTAAEQVILRALAKRPADRYASAQELANAFQMSLVGTGIPLNTGMTGANPVVTPGATGVLFSVNRTAEPGWQTGAMPATRPVGEGGGLLSRTGLFPAVANNQPKNGGSATMGGGLLSRTGKFPQVGTGTGTLFPPAMPGSAATTPPANSLPPLDAQQSSAMTAGLELPKKTNTGALTVPAQMGTGNTMKLTGPVKVVKVPVAGQPGRYLTGILPVTPGMQQSESAEEKRQLRPWVKTVGLLIAALLVIFAAVGTYWFTITRPHPTPARSTTQKAVGTPNVQATAMAQATQVAQNNIILADPLDRNIHNWLETPPDVYAFKNGAYHITDHGGSGRAAILTTTSFGPTLAYTLTMQEINGNDASANNSFGMVFRFNQTTKNGNNISTFYSFEVVNMKGGEYQFWKYDDGNRANGASPWTSLWHAPFGPEFHQGHGPQSVNTVKIVMNGDTFTIIVNGKQLNKTIKDGSYQNGTVGMIVNLDGTEVAFNNLLLTHN